MKAYVNGKIPVLGTKAYGSIGFGLILTVLIWLIDMYLTISTPGVTVVSLFFFDAILISAFVSSIVFAEKLPLWLRVTNTGTFFLWAMYCIWLGRGRTVGLELESFVFSVATFSLLGLWMIVPLFSMWKNLARAKALAFTLLIVFSVAFISAGIEEMMFPIIYPDGTSGSYRWISNFYKMGYDANTGQLQIVEIGGDQVVWKKEQ